MPRDGGVDRVGAPPRTRVSRRSVPRALPLVLARCRGRGPEAVRHPAAARASRATPHTADTGRLTSSAPLSVAGEYPPNAATSGINVSPPNACTASSAVQGPQ
ncbi:hypothetical protein GCM10025787_09160 [Saccharopolyspora rosea]